MRFLVDEMFSRDPVERLRQAGHDAQHVTDVGLAGAEDHDIVAHAAAHDQVVVTENIADFARLVELRLAAGQVVPPVLLVRKSRLPSGAGALAHHLAHRVDRWAEENADPFRHLHWL